ncbi:cell division control protein 2 homolog [Rutidosis leptorrhynchoides]|uniref:cell division control protein 2 homolog n=1 Tax=Rutidosis leptorrhynchoides TaxID=125765 RepID=UPI003A99F7A1
MMEQYELVEKISKGTCNVFYKARDRKTSEIVFVKIIRPKENKKGLSRSFVREPALLKSLKHKNIIRLHARVANKEQCYLVYEYLDMNLGKYMDSYPEFSKDPRLVKTFLYQILCAIDFCHVLGVLHRDLKPANLLIDRINNVVKIAGFSLAREFSIPCMPLTRDVGTLWYKAPEILLGSDLYFAPVDVWSIGCIFAEMVNMKPLFRGESEIDQLMRICKLMGIPNEETWPGVTYFTRFDKTITSWTTEVMSFPFSPY